MIFLTSNFVSEGRAADDRFFAFGSVGKMDFALGRHNIVNRFPGQQSNIAWRNRRDHRLTNIAVDEPAAALPPDNRYLVGFYLYLSSTNFVGHKMFLSYAAFSARIRFICEPTGSENPLYSGIQF
jgi:hypothetical protein